MKTDQEIRDSIERRRQTYIDAALFIWEHPEPIFQEYESSKCLADILEGEGFHLIKKAAGLDTAFVAEWKSGDGGPVIGFMGEFDALPNLSQEADCLIRKPLKENGPGHGCGHHILGTAAMAAAIANKEFLEENGLPGTVRFYGCPAEEGGAGKVLMAQAGLFDDCDAAVSWHPTDDNGIWSINFHAQQKVEFTFHGDEKRGANAKEALQLFYLGAQNLRHHLEPCFIVRSTILQHGDEEGGYPEESKVLYAYRAHVRTQIEAAMEQLHQVARGAALISGCTLKAEYKTGTTELLPNRTLERLMYDKYKETGTVHMTEEDWAYAERMHQALPENGEKATFDLMRLLYEEQAEEVIRQVKGKAYNPCLYPFREIEIHKPGSTDICDVSFTTPTVQCVTACYVKDTLGHSWQEVSQGRSHICMKGMLVAAKVMALTGAGLFRDPEVLKKVRTEFLERRRETEYRPLTARTVVEDAVEGLGDSKHFPTKVTSGQEPDTADTCQKRFKLTFLGIEDDGLAARHAGGCQSLGGNALEALQLFEMAMHVEAKYLPTNCRVTQRILETGDEDMVRVPERTSEELWIIGDNTGDAEYRLRRTALGAALMTGCKVRCN